MRRALALLLLASAARAAPSPAPAPSWEPTLDRVVPAVVAISVCATRPFDTEGAVCSWATGFVVDAERGIILSNRHVVQAGPIVAEALFLDHEEVELRAVYRDPIHDFGFFRFDPSAVRYMPLVEIPLAPDAARVGDEIRVVGNDAGEKLSILGGTLARLDRDAPEYGRNSYNDFNTFYYQAASNTSGGSSGSPVVDVHGRAIALNAGGSTSAASSFYLPLHRVARALDLLREGRPVARGTTQTVFRHLPFDELRRLGLTPDLEARVRAEARGGIGMLVVDEVVPGGPAAGVLEPGDIVLEIDGRLVTTFVPLEEAMDSRIGGVLRMAVERRGERLDLDVGVSDLHALSPSSFLEFSGGIVHPLSFQQARNHAMAARGLYVAGSGYALAHGGIPGGAVLLSVDGKPVPTLERLVEVLSGLPDGARVPVRSVAPGNVAGNELDVLTIDRRWHGARVCTRDDATGTWPCVPLPPPPSPEPLPPASTTFPPETSSPLRELVPSLVMVDCDIPFVIDGLQGDNFRGVGIVVDAERGLVVVDRDTVPAALADVRVTFAGSIEIPGRVEWLHPAHGLAVIAYDPERIGTTPVRGAVLDTRPVQPGEKIVLVGLDTGGRPVSVETKVERVEGVLLPLPNPPRFRESNVDLIDIVDATPTMGGVLADERGRVLAIWTSISTQSGGRPQAFFAGLPSDIVQEMIAPLREGRLPAWRSLGVEWSALSLAEARLRGLPSAEAAAIEARATRRREVLQVRRLTAGTPADALLHEGDLLLAVDGSRAPTLREIERAAQAERVTLSVARDGAVREVAVPTVPLDGRGTSRVVGWAGALLQEPHLALAQQRGAEPGGVYVSYLWFGSPADRHELMATWRIRAVDGHAVDGLDAFLERVRTKRDREPVRLDVVDLEGKPRVVTLKLDLQYWPTFELVRTEAGWRREER